MEREWNENEREWNENGTRMAGKGWQYGQEKVPRDLRRIFRLPVQLVPLGVVRPRKVQRVPRCGAPLGGGRRKLCFRSGDGGLPGNKGFASPPRDLAYPPGFGLPRDLAYPGIWPTKTVLHTKTVRVTVEAFPGGRGTNKKRDAPDPKKSRGASAPRPVFFGSGASLFFPSCLSRPPGTLLWIWLCYGFGFVVDLALLWIWLCYGFAITKPNP